MFGGRTSNGGSKFEKTADAIYRWKSTKQNFTAWDSENQVEIELPKDAILIPLTATNQVTGTKERDHGKATQRYNNVSSNEFINFKEDIVKVTEYDRLDNTRNVIAEGVYSPTVKEAIADLGSVARFTKNIYCLLDGEVVKLALRGASLTPWIKFEQSLKELQIELMHGHGFKVDGYTEEKNGMVTYTSPKFAVVDIDDATEQVSNEKAIEVEQAILRNMQANGTTEATTEFTPKVSDQPTTAEPEDNNEAISLEEIPF